MPNLKCLSFIFIKQNVGAIALKIVTLFYFNERSLWRAKYYACVINNLISVINILCWQMAEVSRFFSFRDQAQIRFTVRLLVLPEHHITEEIFKEYTFSYRRCLFLVWAYNFALEESI